jgi:hypothetical protein
MIKECDGSCNSNKTCAGEIVRVHVFGGWTDWGEFNYCQHAIQEDRKAGLTVNEVNNTNL